MSATTKIEWAEATWNPIRARNRETGRVGWFCTHASPGCELCYAEGFNARLGTGVAFKAQNRDQVELFLDEKILREPLRWRKPKIVFVCSMTDLFGEFVEIDWLQRIFAVMAVCPQHTFIVLTKRAGRMADTIGRGPFGAMVLRAGEGLLLAGAAASTTNNEWPLRNVWLMVSAEDQRRWDERVPALIATPAAVRGVSVEPQIEGIMPGVAQLDDLDWIIQGGESGPGARPFHLEWANAMQMACSITRTAYFLKQVGANALSGDDVRLRLKHSKGGDPDEWPATLRVRQWPEHAA